MGHRRNLELDRKSREKAVDEINQAENNQYRCPKLTHKVWSVEEMQDLENAQTNQEVRSEDTCDICPTYLENLLPAYLNTEEEGDCNE